MIDQLVQQKRGAARQLATARERHRRSPPGLRCDYALDSKTGVTAQVTSNIVWAGDHFGSTALQALTDWLFFDRVEDKCDVIAVDY
jgi:hypothetical protein